MADDGIQRVQPVDLPEFDKDGAVSRWTAFFEDPDRRRRVQEAGDRWPVVRSIFVSYPEILRGPDGLWDQLRKWPDEMRDTAAVAARALLHPDQTEAKRDLRVRINELPDTERVSPGAIRAEHIGKLVKMPGRAKKIGFVQQAIEVAVFQCSRCGACVEMKMDRLDYRKPLECSESAGGCGRKATSTNWILVEKECKFSDLQVVHLEEHPDPDAGHDPRVIRAFLWDDLVGLPRTTNIVMNGVVRHRVVEKKTGAQHETYIEVSSVELDASAQALRVTPADEVAIKEFAAQSPDVIFGKFTRSIAPTLYGLMYEKEAVLLQLFGGVQKTREDGVKIRGDSHILIVGDPSTGKSQLVRCVARLAPIGGYGTGESSSGAGLTFALARDEFDGSWTVDLGLLPQCHGGLVVIDELDKMKQEQRDRLHGAMEQQELNYAKANRSGTLRCKVALLAACNPKEGRFDENVFIGDQVDLPPTLISRFDLIFPLVDKPDEENDRATAEHILAVHAGEDRPDLKPEVDLTFLRKYIAFARDTVVPLLSAEVKALIQERYLDLRRRSGTGAMATSTRQLEAFIRLSESAARARLSNAVEVLDVDRAFRIVDYSLRKVAVNEDGKIDITIVATGRSAAQWDRMKKLKETVKAWGEKDVPIDQLVERLVANEGMSEERVKLDIETLIKHGEAFSPRAGLLRLME